MNKLPFPFNAPSIHFFIDGTVIVIHKGGYFEPMTVEQYKELEMADSELIYEKVIYENEEKAYQLRLTANTFRDVEYVHIRKYFLSFDEGFMPTKEGVAIPASINNIYALLDGLIEICANLEGIESIETHFGERILSLKSVKNEK